MTTNKMYMYICRASSNVFCGRERGTSTCIVIKRTKEDVFLWSWIWYSERLNAVFAEALGAQCRQHGKLLKKQHSRVKSVGVVDPSRAWESTEWWKKFICRNVTVSLARYVWYRIAIVNREYVGSSRGVGERFQHWVEHRNWKMPPKTWKITLML